ncbi:hypothetical protein QT972_11025 [Microcoleus sp. herbarium7]|uniref:hypothetical protein n=1 Tax=Microcoleus sp. herbarium7 TaxID=3055435 RepID=UPI002FD5D231
MTNIVSIQSELSNLGILLHQRILIQLVSEVNSAIAEGRIRSLAGKHSIFDFIREILKQTGERKVWSRLTEAFPPACQNATLENFLRSDGRPNPNQTPVTTTAGLLIIAYCSNSDYSNSLRVSSALLIANDAESLMVPSVKILAKSEDLGNSLTKSQDVKIAELTALLKEWEAKYKQAYDKMQYYQARAMGSDMLTRLKEKPEAFSEDSELLWLISGIASKSYFVSRCREDLEYGVDYTNGSRKGTLRLTPYAALQMLLNFRSRKGVQARYLPETVEVSVKKSIGSDDSKINRRKMQQS